MSAALHFTSYLANAIKDPVAWKIATSVLRDSAKGPANQQAVEAVINTQVVKKGVILGAWTIDTMSGKYESILLDPARAMAKLFDRIVSFSKSLLSMASKIATNSTVLIYMAGVAIIVTGGVITYQWLVKPAAANDAERLVNATRSLDPVANLAWIEQIRQAQMNEGNVFPEEVPSCIVCLAAPPRVACTQPACGALVFCADHLGDWRSHQGDNCPICQQGTTFLTLRLP